jgi:excisionase family DNA binding protein
MYEPMTLPPPLVVNAKEAGRLLGIGTTKVYDLLKKRELPFVKIGRLTRIELAAINAFIDRERIGSIPRVNR